MPMVIQTISSLKYLSEVDLGWTDPPPGFIETFTKHIGQSLIKLFLTACRRKFFKIFTAQMSRVLSEAKLS